MAFLDDLKEKVTDLAQAGVAKSKQMAEIAKLKAANMAEQDAIRKAYLELGKLYYAEKSSAPEGGYVAACDRITRAKANIAENNRRIEELKDGDDEVAAAASEAVVVEETPVVDVTEEDIAPEDIVHEEAQTE